ncbi:hypothetical protein BDK51DRAFT_43480 [Blyttiomyces helicus]|uniref:Uncharacterized protein n=1 Tax=Blyttiomyces helicus TaxID=388810 RepID=A0A4P9WIA9_9FUNG|nr:hypothetical protein BDK51DRAFT_43480 [Blyttiomyces helicus]|eukprot:RKO91613.1 hypothetical protein BDK51DRAFT_43480 [Blyttiomyces helicus]
MQDMVEEIRRLAAGQEQTLKDAVEHGMRLAIAARADAAISLPDPTAVPFHPLNNLQRGKAAPPHRKPAGRPANVLRGGDSGNVGGAATGAGPFAFLRGGSVVAGGDRLRQGILKLVRGGSSTSATPGPSAAPVITQTPPAPATPVDAPQTIRRRAVSHHLELPTGTSRRSSYATAPDVDARRVFSDVRLAVPKKNNNDDEIMDITPPSDPASAAGSSPPASVVINASAPQGVSFSNPLEGSDSPTATDDEGEQNGGEEGDVDEEPGVEIATDSDSDDAGPGDLTLDGFLAALPRSSTRPNTTLDARVAAVAREMGKLLLSCDATHAREVDDLRAGLARLLRVQETRISAVEGGMRRAVVDDVRRREERVREEAREVKERRREVEEMIAGWEREKELARERVERGAGAKSRRADPAAGSRVEAEADVGVERSRSARGRGEGIADVKGKGKEREPAATASSSKTPKTDEGITLKATGNLHLAPGAHRDGEWTFSAAGSFTKPADSKLQEWIAEQRRMATTRRSSSIPRATPTVARRGSYRSRDAAAPETPPERERPEVVAATVPQHPHQLRRKPSQGGPTPRAAGYESPKLPRDDGSVAAAAAEPLPKKIAKRASKNHGELRALTPYFLARIFASNSFPPQNQAWSRRPGSKTTMTGSSRHWAPWLRTCRPPRGPASCCVIRVSSIRF